MTERLLSLGNLAYVCNLYDTMTPFGRSFRDFQSRVDNKPDLDNPHHRDALLEWLNAWGCRHLARAQHPDASEAFAAWYEVARDELPSPALRLMGIDDDSLEEFALVFDHLSALRAVRGHRNDRSFPIPFGATAASKTLFALRPHFFVAWDESLRKWFNGTCQAE